MNSKGLFCWVIEHQSFFKLNSLGLISNYCFLEKPNLRESRNLHAVCALVLDVIPACDFVIL